MQFVLIPVVVMAVASFLGTRRHPAVSLLGQGILLLIVLGFGAGIVFCLVYPMIHSGNGNGVMMLGAVPLFFLGLIPWALLKTVQDIVRVRRLSPEEREQFLEGGKAAIDAQIEAETQDTGYVKGSMLSTADRMHQRERMKHSKVTLALIKMMAGGNKKPL